MPDDADIARAQALGRAAARAGLRVTTCPYPWWDSDVDNRILRMRWALAYAGAGGRPGIDLPVDEPGRTVRQLLYSKPRTPRADGRP